MRPDAPPAAARTPPNELGPAEMPPEPVAEALRLVSRISRWRFGVPCSWEYLAGYLTRALARASKPNEERRWRVKVKTKVERD